MSYNNVPSMELIFMDYLCVEEYLIFQEVVQYKKIKNSRLEYFNLDYEYQSTQNNYMKAMVKQ